MYTYCTHNIYLGYPQYISRLPTIHTYCTHNVYARYPQYIRVFSTTYTYVTHNIYVCAPTTYTWCTNNTYVLHPQYVTTIRFPQYDRDYIVGNPCGCSTYMLWVHNVYIVGRPQYIRQMLSTIYTSFTHNRLSTIYSLASPTIYTYCCPQYIHLHPQYIPAALKLHPQYSRIYCGCNRISCSSVHSVYILWVQI